MKQIYRIILSCVLLVVVTLLAPSHIEASALTIEPAIAETATGFQKPDVKVLKAMLTEQQYAVTQKNDTEPPLEMPTGIIKSQVFMLM